MINLLFSGELAIVLNQQVNVLEVTAACNKLNECRKGWASDCMMRYDL